VLKSLTMMWDLAHLFLSILLYFNGSCYFNRSCHLIHHHDHFIIIKYPCLSVA
jgi:hypothetical protein